MDTSTIIAITGIMITVILQTVTVAFFMGRLFEKVASNKRRIEALEAKPVVNHEAKLAVLDTTLQGIKDAMKDQKESIEERFKALEQTFRNMVQLAVSGKRDVG